ncbi:MAG: hypothetical protein AAGF23_15040 [Acidobacteriota bacterium]
MKIEPSLVTASDRTIGSEWTERIRLEDNKPHFLGSGRSLTMRFSDVGGESLATLILVGGDGGTIRQPILGSGEEIRFAAAGRPYLALVHGIVWKEKYAEVEISVEE